MKFISLFLIPVFAATPVYSQTPAVPVPSTRPAVQPEVSGPDPSSMLRASSNYVLGAGDQIELRVTPESEDLTGRTFRIDSEGNLNLPLAGSVRASGLTAEELETAIASKLSDYIRSPKVTVTITQFRNDPVLVTGLFAQPGVYPLQPSSRKLLEVLSTVGGLQATASRRIRLTRRLENGPIPLPGAVVDETAKVSSVEINLTKLMEAVNPVENIELAPYDVLYAGKAGMVFLNIEGSKAGAYPLDGDYLSVVQLISLAGGITPGLAPEKARVLRPVLDTTRRAEIPLDVKAILDGKQNDYVLLPDDMLVIPKERSVRSALTRPLTLAVPVVVTSLIWATVRR